jgi:hypothetical protein
MGTVLLVLSNQSFESANSPGIATRLAISLYSGVSLSIGFVPKVGLFSNAKTKF